MERYLKDHEPQIKPEPLDMVEAAIHTSHWIKSELLADGDEDYDDAFGGEDGSGGGVLLKHEFLIKSEPSDLEDTDDDRLSLDDLNIWDQRLSSMGGVGVGGGGKTTELSSGSSTGFLSSSSSTSSIHSLDGDAPPPYSSSSPSPLLHSAGGKKTSPPPPALPNGGGVNASPAVGGKATTGGGVAVLGRIAASPLASAAAASVSPLDRREQLTVRVAAPASSSSGGIPIQTLTPPSSPESGSGGGGSGSGGATSHPVRTLPTGLVRVTGPNGTRSAIIRVTARGGKMIPRLISFAPASAFKSLSETHLRLEQALGRWTIFFFSLSLN